MKKRLGTILLTISLFIFGISGVNAASFNLGDKYNKYGTLSSGVSGLFVTGNGKNRYDINHYSFKSLNDSTNYENAFCLDAHKGAVNSNYNIERLMLQSSDSPLLKGYDAGIIEIIKIVNQGSYTYSVVTPESTPNNYTATLEGNYLYVAASIAIRALTDGAYLWGGEPTLMLNGKISYYGVNQVSAHVTLGYRWAAMYSTLANKALNVKCGSGEEAVKCYQQRANKKYGDWYNDSEFVWGSKNSEGYNVIYGAQQLFKIALEKAAEVRDKGLDTPNISHNLGNAQNIEKNEKFVRESYTLSINFSNFDAKDGKLYNIWVNCPECNINGVVPEAIEFKNPKTGNWETLNGKGDTNFLSYFNEKNGTISGSLLVRYTVRKPSSESGCKNVQFQIHYGFSDPKLKYQGAVLKLIGDTENKNQRFVILNEVNDGSKTVYGTIGCAPCETEVSVPVCSDDPKKAVATIKAPTNIKKCILNNWDDAGNSYQLSASNGGVSNDYCGVFCKEDYASIKLNPVVKGVVCGGYFQLKSHIEGKKDCYTAGNTTTKEIDRAKFNADVKEAQEKMIDAYNEYAKWSAAAAISSTGTYMSDSAPGRSEKYTCGEDKKSSCNVACDGDSVSATGYSKEWSWYEYNYDGTRQTTAKSDSYGPGSVSCGTCSCSNNAARNRDNEHRTNASNAQTALRQAIANYERIISDFNACTTGWSNDYEFQQKIKYYFNEYRYNQAYTPYYDLLMSADKEELYYLDKVKGSLKENSSVTICLDGTNDDYSCRGRYVTFKGEVDKTKTDKYNYNSAYTNGIFEDEKHIVCSTSGCSVETRKVSQAKFVKKTVEKEQDYITPSAFYQTSTSGRVTVNSGYVGNVVQLHAIKNGLPVSTKSSGGGIFKLQLEDLGEFYDTGELGRLFDFQGKNEDKSVAKNSNKGVGTFTGQYTCHYKNNCPPSDRTFCPNCEFVCDDDDCEWKECPDCKFDCVNCLFSEGNLNINFKPISSTNFGSSGRKYGYNWITTSKVGSLGLLTEKADKTISDIIKDNETIYIDPDKAGDDSSLAFSIKLTKEVINKIKEYNAANEDKGGYANDSLTCKNAVVDGVTYENIYCYSELIDKLVDEHSDLIIVKNRDDETKYWTLWESPKLKDESLIGGPAWK